MLKFAKLGGLLQDMKVIAKIMFGWARERGCIDFAHWFFPTRGGGGGTLENGQPVGR